MPRSRCSWILFALILSAPFAARALDREVVLRWLPPSGSVNGYRVYLGTPGQPTQAIDLGAIAPDSDGIAREALQLDAAKAYTVNMTAYNQVGESTQSNQIAVPASTCDLAACNDGDPCTADDCQNLACTHARLPDGAVCASGSICLSGACRVPQCTTNAACADADACDGLETCSNFNCVSGAPLSCPAPGPCQQGGCAASSGCWTTNLADGTSCNDFNASTVDDRCSAGRCAGSSVPAPPPPSAAGQVSLIVVGNPATGPWGVEGFTTNSGDVQATVRLDGAVHHVEHFAPYGFPDDNGTTATVANFGPGSHTVEFVFALEGTTTEIGRASMTVQEGSSTPLPGCSADSQCSDGNACNGAEICGAGGACTAGTPLVCGGATQCADPICSPGTGCALTPKPDGTSCDDGQTSTTADRCSAGQCRGTPVTADALSLSAVAPTSVRGVGFRRISLSGTGFVKGMKVSFRSVSAKRAPWVYKVIVLSPQEAEVQIVTVLRASAATWDVMVTLPDGRTAGLPAAFRTDP